MFNDCIIDEICLQNLSKSPSEPQGFADHSLHTTRLESGGLVRWLSSAQLGCNIECNSEWQRRRSDVISKYLWGLWWYLQSLQVSSVAALDYTPMHVNCKKWLQHQCVFVVFLCSFTQMQELSLTMCEGCRCIQENNIKMDSKSRINSDITKVGNHVLINAIMAVRI
jgi:hypothetical protein